MCSDQLELPLISLNNTIADNEHGFTTPPAQIRAMVKCPREPSTNKRRRKAVVEQLFSENKDVNNTNKELIFIPVYNPLTKRQLGLNLNDTKFVFKTVYDPIRKRFYNPAYQFRLVTPTRKEVSKDRFFFHCTEHEAEFNIEGGVAVDGANKKKIMYCTSLCLSSDGSTLFSGYTDGVVRVWGIGHY